MHAHNIRTLHISKRNPNRKHNYPQRKSNKMIRVTALTMLTTLFVQVSVQQNVNAFNIPINTPAASSSGAGAASAAKKILIVGGGIGGLSSAFDAKHNLRQQDEVTVVSDREDFQFTPSNPWVATRARSPEDISLPLNEVLPRNGINFVHGKAASLDPLNHKLKLSDGRALPYDFLIIATGPRLAFDEIPGAISAITNKSKVLSVCTTPHASHTASEIDQLVEHPGPVVVGATQGASCFGPAYEFALLLQDELQKRGGLELVNACPMTFVTPEPYIGHLGLKGAGNSKAILEKLLNEKRITFHTNCAVDKVTSEYVLISKMDDPSSKKIKLPTKFTMLIPPFRGHDVWRKVSKLTDDKGMIMVNDFQQSIAYPDIFGVGVCVSIPPIEKTLVPTGAPKTGYMIESQGTAAVKNIRQLIDYHSAAVKHNLKNEDTANPEIRNRPLLNGLCITDFGGTGAIFVTLPQYPPRRTDITIEGKIATLAKIAFEKYFLHKIESGDTDPYYEKYMLHLVGIDRVTSKAINKKN